MKRIMILALFAALTVGAAVAQTASANASATDVKLFGIEAGVSLGYTLSGATAGGSAFGLSLVVADNVTVGFQTTSIGVGYNTFKLSYFLNPTLGFTTYLGKSIGGAVTTAAGLGAFFNAGRNTSSNGMASSYRIKVDYFFETPSLAAGTLGITAAMSLGL